MDTYYKKFYSAQDLTLFVNKYSQSAHNSNLKVVSITQMAYIATGDEYTLFYTANYEIKD